MDAFSTGSPANRKQGNPPVCRPLCLRIFQEFSVDGFYKLNGEITEQISKISGYSFIIIFPTVPLLPKIKAVRVPFR